MMVLTLAVALTVQDRADTAQGAGRPCEVAIDSMARAYTRPQGRSTNYFGGGGIRAHCKGTTTTLAADTMAYFSALGRLDLLGQVRIRDTTMWLDANFVSYFTGDERLEARNRVVAVNPRTGSVLRGPNLRYLRAVKGIRDTVELYATSRPTVEYREAPDSGEPYVIMADRIRLRGDDRVWAGGKVTVDRSDFASRSDSLRLDQTTGFGALVGQPRVEGRSGKTYTLVGARIELGLEQREVRLVKALGLAKATGEDWTLTADTIHLLVEERKLQQALSWGDSARPRAISSLYTIRADSLAIDTPREVLTESRAFGRALATAKRDSTSPAADSDWIAGDSLTVRFVQEKDSTGRERSRLQQIHARGSARALTHHFDARDSTAAPALNYSRGRSIAVALKGDRIDRVVVGGRADGVHLEPRPPAPPDTAKPAPPPPHPPKAADAMTTADRLADLFATRDSSLALAAAALARIADERGRAPFGDLAVAYREEFLKLRAHAKGATLPEAGSLSVDHARAYLATSVLPRLGMLKVLVLPAGALWGEAPVGFAPEVWAEMPGEREAAARRFLEIAEQTLARSEAVSGEHPAMRGASRLEARQLVKTYKGRRVVNDVSVDLAQGEIVGLLGPNGAGKTTTFYMITGLIRPEEGRVVLDGADITTEPMYRRARAGIGYLAQEPSVFRKLTVEENVLAILETLPLEGSERDRRLEGLLDELAIKHLRRQKAYQLSGGERRRLEITRALVTEPKFLLLDEPFAGVDPIAVHDIQTIVAGLRHRGIGVLITDHNVEQTLDIVDRAYIMFEGRVQVAGTVRELVFDDRVADLYLGPTLTARLRARLTQAA